MLTPRPFLGSKGCPKDLHHLSPRQRHRVSFHAARASGAVHDLGKIRLGHPVASQRWDVQVRAQNPVSTVAPSSPRASARLVRSWATSS